MLSPCTAARDGGWSGEDGGNVNTVYGVDCKMAVSKVNTQRKQPGKHGQCLCDRRFRGETATGDFDRTNSVCTERYFLE